MKVLQGRGWEIVLTDNSVVSDLKDDDDTALEWNAAVDTLESFLLALHVQGVRLGTPTVLEALNTTIDALAENFGDD